MVTCQTPPIQPSTNSESASPLTKEKSMVYGLVPPCIGPENPHGSLYLDGSVHAKWFNSNYRFQDTSCDFK
ncbi:unnamed protein product [Acanthoscelides obtectus]|uniref:Uncharacterized protein n=1 Tax=Acanthoscelides obtectus TaxID=200917 RepID=A0A9P0LPX7_ACAOB|nr:unnamed protein product [Acanthoscelides obtectus]CAK1649669.1 hypothetical protein AOBTE_LOCUS16351 [Acanthoscelides obtectus]